MYTDHQNNFNSKYPIICSGMTTVSNVKLALAVKETGCYPSFVTFNHTVQTGSTFIYDPKVLREHLTYYINKVGDSDFILGLNTPIFTDSTETFKIILELKPAYIEMFDNYFVTDPRFPRLLKQVQENGTKVLGKFLSFETVIEHLNKNSNVMNSLDGIILKGDKGAGRVSSTTFDLVEAIRALRLLKPNWIIIAQGGIYDSQGIKEHLSAGANIVSLGTVFAVSEESVVSLETKKKMLESSYSETVKIGTANQSGFLFSKTALDIENNTYGLAKGIQSPNEGHVFAGGAIDHITSIKPVKQIVEELTVGL